MMSHADDNDPRKYRQLAASLRAKIQDGTIAEGELVSGTKLAAENGWARQTCAHALQVLEKEGFLTRYVGLGYQVTPRNRQR